MRVLLAPSAFPNTTRPILLKCLLGRQRSFKDSQLSHNHSSCTKQWSLTGKKIIKNLTLELDLITNDMKSLPSISVKIRQIECYLMKNKFILFFKFCNTYCTVYCIIILSLEMHPLLNTGNLKI